MNINKSKQQGAILVISLLILAVITIVSITGMRTATTGEKLASNVRDRNVAFQSAEHGLSVAETRFSQTTPGGALLFTNISVFNGLNGLLGTSDNEPNYFTINWTNANSQSTNGLDRIATESNSSATAATNWIAPRYIIKHIGNDDQCKGSNPITKDGGYGEQDLSCEVDLFKIVSRSQGLSPNSVVFLQSYFAATGL